MRNQTNISLQLEELFDSIPIATLFLDSSGSCKFANKAWESLTGVPKNEALGNGWSLLVANLDVAKLAQSLSTLLQSHIKSSLDLRYKVASGSTVWTKLYFQTISMGNDEFSGFLVSLFDVGTLVSKIQSLKRQHKELDHLNRLSIDRGLKMAEQQGIINK